MDAATDSSLLEKTLLVLYYFFLSTFFTGLLLWVFTCKYNHLPGSGLPIIGNLYSCYKNIHTSIHGFLQDLSDTHKKYGDTVAFHVGPLVMISTADPFLIEELSYHPKMASKEKIIYGIFHGIFAGPFARIKADETWKQQKKAISSKLKRMDFYLDTFCRRSKELANKLATKPGEFDIYPWVMLNMLDIVLETHCGVQSKLLDEEQIGIHEELLALITNIADSVISMGMIKPKLAFLRKQSHFYPVLEKVLNEIVAKTNNSQSESDFEPMCCSMIRDLHHNGKSFEDMIKLINEVIMEGQYSTGTSLSSALLFLAMYPEYQEKAWEEQKQIFGESLQSPAYGDLGRMVYLQRVIKESIRLTSPPAFARRSDGCIKTATGIVIPNNSTVIFFWDALRKDRRYWKNGGRFDPNHFLPEEMANKPKCAYYAFSAGTRACPGYQYSIACSKVVLSQIIRSFKITTSLKPEDLTFKVTLMSHIEGPQKVSLELRNSLLK